MINILKSLKWKPKKKSDVELADHSLDEALEKSKAYRERTENLLSIMDETVTSIAQDTIKNVKSRNDDP